MKKIVFYISNHGFGHASRNIPLIKGLLNLDSDLKIIVKTGSEQLKFMKQSLKNYASKIAFYEENTDVGLILKKGKLEIDKKALEKELLNYILNWDKKIINELDFLNANSVDLVVSDIVPWIFKSCKQANIKSIFISNFTWIEIYKEYFNEYIYDKYLDCYKLADKAFLYSLYNEELKKYFKVIEEIGLCCREFNEMIVNKIKNVYKGPKVFVSVGRSVNLEEEIDVNALPYHFICTGGIKLKGENVTYLPLDIDDTQDYIKACDYIITKAGWGTIAEAICAKKPMAIIRRDFIAEDRITKEKVENLGLGISIDYNDLKSKNIVNLFSVLKRLNSNYKNIDIKFNNCSLDICNKILNFLMSGDIYGEK